MGTPVKLNFKIYQGSTFNEVLRWESSTKIYKSISGITNTAPVKCEAIAHGIPEGWRVRVTNVLGMKEINSLSEDYYIASNCTADTFEINNVNALEYKQYVSGGVVEFNTPVDLDQYTGRMQIREKIDSEEIILELTSENSRIIVDNISKTIRLYIDAVTTAELTFNTAVYSLELVRGVTVLPFLSGNISLVKEVTR